MQTVMCESCGMGPAEYRVHFKVPHSEVVYDTCRGCIPRIGDDNDEMHVEPLILVAVRSA